MADFRWNPWNLEHIEKHGVSPLDAEYVVRHARPPYPEYRGDGKWAVAGQTREGYYIQVIYVLDPDKTIFVIHSRPLKMNEKRKYRRRRR